MTPWRWFWISCAASIATVTYYGGSPDETCELTQAVTKITPPFLFKARAIGFHWILRVFFPYLGGDYYLYRLIIMLFGLSAIAVIAYCIRRSSWGILAMASILWMPYLYGPLRTVRYEMIHLFLVSIQVLWLCEWRRGSVMIGVLSGLAPFVTMTAVMTSVSMAIMVLLSFDLIGRRKALFWLGGFAIGGLLTLHFYPYDDLVYSKVLYTNLYGLGNMTHQWSGHNMISEFFRYFGSRVADNSLGMVPLLALSLSAIVFTITTSALSRFAFVLSIVHFSMTYNPYPPIVTPILLAAAFNAIG